MCESATEKSVLEEKFWRCQLAYMQVDYTCQTGVGSYSDKDALDRSIKETIIKLFAVSHTFLMWTGKTVGCSCL
jgi:hypothetical protein